jgi:dTDP-4-amino-4,6-dideoxy-D-galactose acyltransferase
MPRADAAPAELLPWDSEFFGRTIGRVTAETLTPETFAAVESWAAEHRVECLYLEAAADDAVAIRTAEDGGFRLVEIRVVLRRPRRPRFPFDQFPPAFDGVLVREGRMDDLEELRRIAADSYNDSRFYVDPNFPDERAGALYATWIAKSLEGYQGSTVLVAEVDGRVAGFSTTRESGAFAHIGLIAVDPELMRSTLAPRVAHSIGIALLRWADERNLGIHAVTQGRNVRTQRYIQRYGPYVHSLSLYFHKWYTP